MGPQQEVEGQVCPNTKWCCSFRQEPCRFCLLEQRGKKKGKLLYLFLLSIILGNSWKYFKILFNKLKHHFTVSFSCVKKKKKFCFVTSEYKCSLRRGEEKASLICCACWQCAGCVFPNFAPLPPNWLKGRIWCVNPFSPVKDSCLWRHTQKKKKNAHAYTHARADLKKKVINRELYKAPHSPRSLLKTFDQEVLRFHINGWIPFRDHAKRTATWGGFGLL